MNLLEVLIVGISQLAIAYFLSAIVDVSVTHFLLAIILFDVLLLNWRD